MRSPVLQAAVSGSQNSSLSGSRSSLGDSSYYSGNQYVSLPFNTKQQYHAKPSRKHNKQGNL